MPTDIDLRNLSGHPIDEDAVREAAQRALQAEGAELLSLSLAFVDDERIAALNRRLLGRDGVTDVIAFEAEQGEGEVIISVTTAVRQAREQGHGLTDELRLLVAHGVLHVLGWDDTDETDRERMLERQRSILADPGPAAH